MQRSPEQNIPKGPEPFRYAIAPSPFSFSPSRCPIPTRALATRFVLLNFLISRCFFLQKTSTKNPIETLQATSSRKIPLNNKDDSSQEENEKFQKIISDPEIREILNNQRIQHLIGVLKENPAVAQRYVKSCLEIVCLPRRCGGGWGMPLCH